jgi:hypothetical protein
VTAPSGLTDADWLEINKPRSDHLLKTLSIGLACIAFYLFGAVSDRHGIFPVPQLISLREKVMKPESRYALGGYILDAQDRMIGDAEKPAVACPKQTDRTAVLLVLGQSNAANYGGQRFASKRGDKISSTGSAMSPPRPCSVPAERRGNIGLSSAIT